MRILFICLLLAFSTSTFALGQTGHRITGAIAERHINQHTKSAIEKILGSDTLTEVTNYADEMRTDPSDFWQHQARHYHYVTVPKGKKYSDEGVPKQGDAVFALDKYSKVILNPKSIKSEKQLALKFIVHIIGDLHQPLHVGSGEDRGGNNVKLKFFRKDTNLHRIWDTGLIKQKHLSYSEWTNWLDREITTNDIKQWRSIDPLVWINENVKIRDSIYPKSDSISFRYLYKNMPIMRLRLKQAGIRMAFFLDELFKKQN